MKRRFCLLSLLFFTLVLSACAGGGARFMGKSLEPQDITDLTADRGEHTYATKAFSLQYNYFIEPGNGRMTLDGRIASLLDPTKHPLGAVLNRLTYEDIYIWVLFTNETGMVIDSQEIHLSPSYQISIPVVFKRTLPFNPAYRGMSMHMKVFMRDGQLMLDSHALDYN